MKKKSAADQHRWTRINTDKIKRFCFVKLSNRLCLSLLICGCVFLFSVFLLSNNTDFAFLPTRGLPSLPQKVSAESADDAVENALYTKQEFFGSQAIVPLPTHEARENLARLAEAQPDNREVLEKLAEANEKLERFDEAEAVLIHLSEIDFSKNETARRLLRPASRV